MNDKKIYIPDLNPVHNARHAVNKKKNKNPFSNMNIKGNIKLGSAKKSCKKCYGRGWVGRDDNGGLVVCTCTQRKKK